MLPALVDLVTGSACPGCGDPGRLLCPACLAGLDGRARPAWPTPCPDGLCPPWAAGEYADLLRALVVGHKEHRQLGLAAPLGRLLAGAAEALVADRRLGAHPLVLVPVPSRGATTRARGHEPTRALVVAAAAVLRRRGYDAVPHRLLRVGPVRDQAGLDAATRAANLAGSMAVDPGRLRSLARRRPEASVLVCDDVITTGATAREAQRALEAVGLVPAGVAAVAATRRRTPPGRRDHRPGVQGRRFTGNPHPPPLALGTASD